MFLERRAKILCVDDDLTNIRILENILGPQGYEIITAASGEEALARVSDRDPDVVLLDVILPGMSGFDVTKRLRAAERTRVLPVLLITSLTETEDKIKGIEAGCNDFIPKPFDKSELLARVKSMLNLKYAYDELRAANKRLEELSVTDPLTGVYNRRYLFDRLDAEIKRAYRGKTTLSCLIIDIDHFKAINDERGHLAGDAVIKRLADFLKNNVRSTDIVARYGGDEFMLVIPETSEEGARVLAGKLLEGIRKFVFVGEQNTFNVTCSMGLSSFAGGGLDRKLMAKAAFDALGEALIENADDALYEAKKNGRNRVSTYSDTKK
jgi:diguanylate cyclase (GGDEF)-like protein